MVAGSDARPGSKVKKVCPARGPASHRMVKAGNESAGFTRDRSDVPMVNAPSTDRLPHWACHERCHRCR